MLLGYRLDALRAQLAPQRHADPEQAKQWLRANTDAAQAAGVFGVPTFEVNGLHFWGLDSLLGWLVSLIVG